MDVYRQRRCADCGLLFVDCNVSDAYLANLYSQETLQWQRDYVGHGKATPSIGTSRQPEFREVWRVAKAIRNPATGDRLLDFGCQTGEFGAVVKDDAGLLPYGIELSADYAAAARAKWGPDARVHEGDIESSGFQAASFAYVSAQETLEHMPDPRKVLRSFRDLIEADGILIVSVPSSHYFILKFWVFRLIRAASRFVGLRNKSPSHERVLVHTHLYNFTPKSLDRLLHGAGFRVEVVSGIGWHGRMARVGRVIASLVRITTLQRVYLYPSLLCVARPVSTSPRF
ncbi:MAG: class I SAM-dependent methyltransferase [Steroidobacteraceae bacterium]